MQLLATLLLTAVAGSAFASPEATETPGDTASAIVDANFNWVPDELEPRILEYGGRKDIDKALMAYASGIGLVLHYAETDQLDYIRSHKLIGQARHCMFPVIGHDYHAILGIEDIMVSPNRDKREHLLFRLKASEVELTYAHSEYYCHEFYQAQAEERARQFPSHFSAPEPMNYEEYAEDFYLRWKP